MFATLAGIAAAPARAQIGSERYAAIVLDARSGTVLAAANADEQRHPASLTKMMTLYMVFEALREGRLQLDSRIPISEEAASRPPSKLGVPAGQSISVEQAILALVTRSANDVATAVGERLGGTEYRFAQMMTLRARSLGMNRTLFRNASGLPDPQQVTTARDMATLGQRLIQDFPNRYHYFGVTHAEFGAIRIRNHNRMLQTYEGVDGIKTGYINASGFNIVTSATRGNRRLVGAVFGGSSWVERDTHMAALLDQGFDRLGLANAAPGGTGILRTAQAAPLPRAQAATTRTAAQTRRATTRQASTRQATTQRSASRQAATRQQATRATASRQTARTTRREATARGAATTTRTATVRARGSQPRTASAAQTATPPRSAARTTRRTPQR
ncbi:D-alanyl-D-alanine carboxypeptidase family protein [Falsiroseomonas bella]|uniref:D-alanyl-D-alanine carboxypeptidase family protein n=1 Tax=Falsiroseomonas bella TaxID=2184016 RepID=UPI001E580702|nr:D-alanyl-D-alanine carboxypeptidase family protein [Falsiroseomonas bella]